MIQRSIKISYTTPRELYLAIGDLKAVEIIKIEPCVPDSTDSDRWAQVWYLK